MALLWALSLIDCKISAFVPLTRISLRKIRLCALGGAIFVQVGFTPPALKKLRFLGLLSYKYTPQVDLSRVFWDKTFVLLKNMPTFETSLQQQRLRQDDEFR